MGDAIDLHNHVIPEQTLELVRNDARFGVRVAEGTWHGPNSPSFPLHRSFYDPQEKLRALDREDIELAAISSPPSEFRYDLNREDAVTFFSVTNAGLRRFAAHDPGRLRWLVNPPVQFPDLAASMFRDAAEAGCVGAAIGTCVARQRLDDPSFAPFWAAADDLRMPVLLHPAFNEPHAGLSDFYFQNVVGNPLETTVAVERLICAGTLDAYPNVRLVLVHAGGYLPYQLGRLRHAATVRPELSSLAMDPERYLDRLYFDTITHDPAALRYLCERVGRERVVIGTDMPFDMAQLAGVAGVRALFDDPRDIVRDNAARLLGILDQPDHPARQATQQGADR